MCCFPSVDFTAGCMSESVNTMRCLHSLGNSSVTSTRMYFLLSVWLNACAPKTSSLMALICFKC